MRNRLQDLQNSGQNSSVSQRKGQLNRGKVINEDRFENVRGLVEKIDEITHRLGQLQKNATNQVTEKEEAATLREAECLMEAGRLNSMKCRDELKLIEKSFKKLGKKTKNKVDRFQIQKNLFITHSKLFESALTFTYQHACWFFF